MQNVGHIQFYMPRANAEPWLVLALANRGSVIQETKIMGYLVESGALWTGPYERPRPGP